LVKEGGRKTLPLPGLIEIKFLIWVIGHPITPNSLRGT
jgi:hypothetical protein